MFRVQEGSGGGESGRDGGGGQLYRDIYLQSRYRRGKCVKIQTRRLSKKAKKSEAAALMAGLTAE